MWFVWPLQILCWNLIPIAGGVWVMERISHECLGVVLAVMSSCSICPPLEADGLKEPGILPLFVLCFLSLAVWSLHTPSPVCFQPWVVWGPHQKPSRGWHHASSTACTTVSQINVFPPAPNKLPASGIP